MFRYALPLTVASLALSAPSFAQTLSAVVREGEPLPGGSGPSFLVSNIGAVSTNTNGGFTCSAATTDGNASLGHIWGTAGIGAPTTLRTETTLGAYTQDNFESFHGISNGGAPIYSASCTVGQQGGVDTVWLGDNLVAAEGLAHPSLPGQYWNFTSRPGCLSTGTPYFAGGLTTTPFGNTELRGLFLGGGGATVLALGGDPVPGLPEPLHPTAGVSFDFRVSADGSNYLYDATMEGPGVTSGTDVAMVRNGVALFLGGARVQEGTTVPPSVGGNGTERWNDFDFCGVNDAGDYMFTGRTSGAGGAEFVVLNGQIAHRAGDLLDGRVLTGNIENAVLNENGDYAFVWDFDTGAGSAEGLWVNGALLAQEGQAVDWDGDGIVDPDYVVTGFFGLDSLGLTSDDRVFFIAGVDHFGTQLAALFEVTYNEDFTSFCFGDDTLVPCPCGNTAGPGEGCANSAGTGSKLSAIGTADTGADTIQLVSVGNPANVPGVFFQASLPAGPPPVLGDGLLCIFGNIQRLQVRFNDGAGQAISTVALGAAGGASPGDVLYYQYWYRDPAGPCGTGSNLSNAIRVEWE